MIELLLMLYGMSTYYIPEEYSDPPILYCGMVAPENTPWVALNVELYQEGIVECGDTVFVTFDSGEVLKALALDAGPFTGYYIVDHPTLPIIVDVPYPLWPNGKDMSAIANVNIYRVSYGWTGVIE